MSNTATTQVVTIAKTVPSKLNLSYQEIEEKTSKAMEGKGHVAEGIDYWDFIEKNRWSLSVPLGDKSRVIPGSFQACHGFKYLMFHCTSCEGIFQLPFEVSACLYCGHKEVEKQRKSIRVGDLKGRAGLSDSINPDLYAQAVKDIQENGSGQSNEPAYDLDWKHLEENI